MPFLAIGQSQQLSLGAARLSALGSHAGRLKLPGGAREGLLKDAATKSSIASGVMCPPNMCAFTHRLARRVLLISAGYGTDSASMKA